MAAAAWWRAWRSRISSNTVHGGGSTGVDGRSSLQPTTGAADGSSIASGTTAYSTTTGSRSTTCTTMSADSFTILQPSVALDHGVRLLSTAHAGDGGNTGVDDGHPPQPSGAGGGSSMASGTTTTTTTGSRSTTCTTMSGSFIIPQPSVVDHELAGEDEERLKKKLKHIEDLVLRFPSDRSAPESWLSELEVAWVLHLGEQPAGRNNNKFRVSGQLLYLARSWIMGLFEITDSISMYLGGRWRISRQDNTTTEPAASSEFIRFFQAALSKMLPFVDVLVAVRTSAEPADEKLQALTLLRDALSTASQQTGGLLPAERLMAKVDAAIWDTMKDTQACFMSSSPWGAIAPESSDIHRITRSLISYIKVLWDNYGTANLILHDAFLRGEPVPDNGNASHLTNFTKEIIHSLEQLLIRNTYSNDSNAPWEKSLQFLFLINNLHFIHQQKQLWPLAFPTQDLDATIDLYIKSYVQVSWAPLLKCLHNPTTPRCFISANSQLPKFEAYFENTYNAQKHWKVPHPQMRKRMREAIVDEIIPAFTEFFKDNNTLTPRISPQEMTRMLQELFEG